MIKRMLPALTALIVSLWPTDALAQGLITAPRRIEIAFDATGQTLFVTMRDGFVRAYNSASCAEIAAYNVGGLPSGLDVSSDGRVLFAGQSLSGTGQIAVHRIELATGALSTMGIRRTSLEDGVYTLAALRADAVLVSTYFLGSGRSPLRFLNPLTGASTAVVAPDGTAVGTLGNGFVARSLDRRLAYVVDFAFPTQAVFVDTATLSVASRFPMPSSAISGALNRDGSLVATRFAGEERIAVDRVTDFRFVRSFDNRTSGFVFDALDDTLYLVEPDSRVVQAFNVLTGEERFRLDIREPVAQTSGSRGQDGFLAVSPDGRWLAVTTPQGVRVLALPSRSQPRP